MEFLSQMLLFKPIIVKILLGGILVQVSSTAAADELVCATGLWRPKFDGVAIFDEAATTGQVLHHLNLGDRVCVVGEKDAFSILDRTRSPALITVKAEKTLLFARTSELWPPRQTSRPRDLIGRVWNAFRGIFWGIPPDDVFGPYRDLQQQIPESEPK